jgi:hypothetical protein
MAKISILKRVGSILVPRGVFRLIIQTIGCTFIVKIVQNVSEVKIKYKYYVNYLDLLALTSQIL